jgi:hypothetical protein
MHGGLLNAARQFAHDDASKALLTVAALNIEP